MRLLVPSIALALLAATAVTVAQPANDAARSVALFREAGKVFESPRCLNCHPVGDRPTQTDSMRPHVPLVVRGTAGNGPPSLPCSTCHHAANYDAANVPGHPGWRLAPESMGWQGRSLGEICRQLKDPALNGGRDLPALLKHVSEDGLVGWAWSPGMGRTPAPGTQAEFGKVVGAWIDSGAHCPGD